MFGFQGQHHIRQLGGPLILPVIQGRSCRFQQLFRPPGQFGNFTGPFPVGQRIQAGGVAVEPAQVAIVNTPDRPGDLSVKLPQFGAGGQVRRQLYPRHQLVGILAFIGAPDNVVMDILHGVPVHGEQLPDTLPAVYRLGMAGGHVLRPQIFH